MFPNTLQIGTQSLPDLIAALEAAGVPRNEYAETLLADLHLQPHLQPQTLTLVTTTVQALAPSEPATFAALGRAAARQSLVPCPPVTAAYLRLAYRNQPANAAPVHAGVAPVDSLTVIAPPLSTDETAPRGFYLRTIDGIPWLRGYRCSDDYVWQPGDRLVFVRGQHFPGNY